MDKTPSDDYAQGQMMGMLCIIQLIENAEDNETPIAASVFENIKRIATASLAEYLQKPEEDVIMLVDNALRNI